MHRNMGLATLVVISFVPAAQANHAWSNYHWARQSNPFNLRLGDNVSTVWDGVLSTASIDWSASTVLDTTIVTGGTTGRQCRASLGRVEVCNATYGNNGWLGIAQIWIIGSHITQGIVKVNDTHFNTSTYNKLEWRRLVMCQEIGHTFGLTHQDENFNNTPLGTCMDYSSNPIPNQHPNQHDYDQLVTIYSHFDTLTTVGGASSTQKHPAEKGDFEGQGQWGRVVSETRSGKKQTYELDFGGGHKVVTFVTWVEGRERGKEKDKEK